MAEEEGCGCKENNEEELCWSQVVWGLAEEEEGALEEDKHGELERLVGEREVDGGKGVGRRGLAEGEVCEKQGGVFGIHEGVWQGDGSLSIKKERGLGGEQSRWNQQTSQEVELEGFSGKKEGGQREDLEQVQESEMG